ncbi:Rrp15p-domain-containing protein [Morchella conica CCBAS932]|uniref:Rrp15p-domain-containing protein n=1 Tax=Morchella conica CCBAS932 TaxID=1392247 RepID=A0A3N4KED4_9PEZI|nr:Rrp15p-domain-containing protein [Morchella conica CCBAS932]
MAPRTKKTRTTKPAPPIEHSDAESSDSDDAGVALEDEFDLDAASDSADEFEAGGSDDDEKTNNGESSGEEDEEVTGDEAEEEDEDEDDIDDILAAQNAATGKKRKRNDPAVFADAMSKILSSHLTTTARKDPVLVRAKKFQENIDESKLEAKARRVLRDEKRKELEKGRIKEVVPKDDDEAARKALEHERKLRKTAQRGVVKLFNAVRAAQIKAEEAQKQVKQKGVVGMTNREEKVTEMSKQGFLSLIQAGGKTK